jgi:hypothetical protein
MEHITIELRRARADPPAHAPEFQAKLRAFAQSLRQAGIAYAQQGPVGYSRPEFSVALLPPQYARFAMVLAAWLRNQAGRVIGVTTNDDAFDLQTADDVEGFINKMEQIHEDKARKGGERSMTRVIEHRRDADAGEEVFELRVFQLRDADVRACVVPADLPVNLDLMADMGEPVAQAYLDAIALCEAEGVSTLWVHDPLNLFPPDDRPERDL